MRIAIDLQSAQTVSKSQNIGYFSLSLAQAIARSAKEHEIWLVLNSAFPDTIFDIRHTFKGLIPPHRIRIFDTPFPVAEQYPENAGNARVSELIYEYFLQQLNPDIVLITSLFEGYTDNAVISVGQLSSNIETAVILYDLPPYLQQTVYSSSDEQYDHYIRKKSYLDKVDLLLSLSKLSIDSKVMISDMKKGNTANFLWDSLAKEILSLMENHKKQKASTLSKNKSKPKLAYFSPMPPIKSSVCDYSAKLLPFLAKYYDIVLIVDQDDINQSCFSSPFPSYSNTWFLSHVKEFDRIIYQFGNSPDHTYMWPILKQYPGMVVLHDFSIDNMLSQNEIAENGEEIGALFHSHGYWALKEYFVNNDAGKSKAKYPCNLELLESAKGIITHSESLKKLAEKWYQDDTNVPFEVIPYLQNLDRKMLKEENGEITDFTGNPTSFAKKYKKTIESCYSSPKTDISTLVTSIVNSETLLGEDSVLFPVAEAIHNSALPSVRQKQLLVDVSAIIQLDLKTGIQRVVRAQLLELIRTPPQCFRVEPVYLSEKNGWHYRYAREYACKLLDLNINLSDDLVKIDYGDILYMPDFNVSGTIQAYKDGLFERLKIRGAEIYSLIHDMLPITMPDYFPKGNDKPHYLWLKTIAEFSDCLVCISQSVADDIDSVSTDSESSIKSVKKVIVHHGADISSSLPTTGLPSDSQVVLSELEKRQSFLMVGTIEPRKGHLQTIEAFEELWKQGIDVNLVIVGGEGWAALPDSERKTIPQIVTTLRNHHELNKRLFWLEGISDEYLEKLYAASACLIAASTGEGFGLPLIEAAQCRLPIIARDIPVFREVAKEYAYYFDNDPDPQVLADSVKNWLKLFEKDVHPKSDDMPWLTWRQNAQNLIKVFRLKSDCSVSGTPAETKK